MDFKDQIKNLGDRVEKLREQIMTEEGTKNAFIMPFIQTLGYDVFNPIEVVPEFITDIGTKKGEKIDYAIFREGKPTILIECKHWQQNLNLHDGQLLRYFHVSKAKFALLTNGVVYRFYSDIDEANKMDETPFLDFNILDMKDNQVEELKKFHKSYFDIENIVNTASELKYTNSLKHQIQKEFSNPSPDFVKYFTKLVYPSIVTSRVLELFTELTKKSIQQYINDLITDRLKTALNNADEATGSQSGIQSQNTLLIGTDKSSSGKIVTTEEELEGFMIVKTILRQKIEVKRITYRDAQTYFSILLDDNNRKNICRLYFNGQKKYISFTDEEKKETKYELGSLDDIFAYSELLMQKVDFFETVRE